MYIQKSQWKIDFLPIFSPIFQVLSRMLDWGRAGLRGSLHRAWGLSRVGRCGGGGVGGCINPGVITADLSVYQKSLRSESILEMNKEKASEQGTCTTSTLQCKNRRRIFYFINPIWQLIHFAIGSFYQKTHQKVSQWF